MEFPSGKSPKLLTEKQCCGSGIFIPDPNFFNPGSRVKKIPGSRIRIRIKEFKYFNTKDGFKQGFGSGSVLDPYSIGPLDPDPDP